MARTMKVVIDLAIANTSQEMTIKYPELAPEVFYG